MHIPAGRVHSVATLGPRVCLSLYSTAAFAKGKTDKAGEMKKVVDKVGEKKVAEASTQNYQKQKRMSLKEAEDPEKTKKKKSKKRK